MDVEADNQTTSDFHDEKGFKINVPIVNEEDWDLFLKKLQTKCYYFKLKLRHHYDAWWKLIDTAHLKKNEKQSITDCLKEMIDSMPVGTSFEDYEWTCYIKLIYYLKKNGKISSECANFMLKLIEKKVAMTYTKVSCFWSTIRNLEKEETDSDELDKEKFFETYKNQFSAPYIGMSVDYEEFMKIIKEKGFENDSETKMIKSLYDENEAEAKRITKDYMGCFVPHSHHFKFEDWINNLLDENPPLFDLAVALCEESVVDEKLAYCYHLMLIKALIRRDISECPESQQKLFKTMKRGIRLGQYGCERMVYYFLDYGLQAAATYLNTSQCLELLGDVIKRYNLKYRADDYFESRKAIMFFLKALVSKGKLPIDQFKSKVAVLNSELEEVPNTENIGLSLIDFELRCIELKKLLLLTEKKLEIITNLEMMNKWELIFSNFKYPEVVMEYTEFVREYGCSTDAVSAYLKAIEHFEELNKSPNCTYDTRRYHLIFINKLRDFLAVNETASAAEIINSISRTNSLYNDTYGEVYYLQYNVPVKWSQPELPECKHTEEDSASVKLSNSSPQSKDSNGIPVNEMKKLSVHQDSTSVGFPIFLSNMSYKVTKEDIIDTFKTHGLEVVKIIMKVSPKGVNIGFATVELASKAQASEAVKNLDGIKILGRTTFVSKFKERSKKSSPTKLQPTVLFVSGLPQEWRDSKKIEDTLKPYGHIKSVEVQEDVGTAKIEYHMSGDVYVGCCKLEEVFEGTKVNIRTGFSSQKPGNQEHSKKPVKQEHSKALKRTNITNDSHGKKQKTLPLPENEFTSENKSVNERRIVKTFVPQQLRNQMKKKLDLTSPDVANNSPKSSQSSAESEELEPCKEKRMKVKSDSPEQKMTNSDFRKMFLK